MNDKTFIVGIMDTWPKRLRRMRAAAGLTQDEVGQRLGVKGVSVAQWESGKAKPRFDRLSPLAKLYGVPFDEMCGDDLREPSATRGTSGPTKRENNKNIRLKAARVAYYGRLEEDEKTAAKELKVEREQLLAVEDGQHPLTDDFIMTFCATTKTALDWIVSGDLNSLPPKMAARVGFHFPWLVPGLLDADEPAFDEQDQVTESASPAS